MLNIFILEIPQIQIQTQRLIHSKKFYFRLFSHCESIVQYSNIYHRSDCHIQPKPRVRFFLPFLCESQCDHMNSHFNVAQMMALMALVDLMAPVALK